MDKLLKCAKCEKKIEQEERIYPLFFYLGVWGAWYPKNSFCKDCAGLANFLGILILGFVVLAALIVLVIKFS